MKVYFEPAMSIALNVSEIRISNLILSSSTLLRVFNSKKSSRKRWDVNAHNLTRATGCDWRETDSALPLEQEADFSWHDNHSCCTQTSIHNSIPQRVTTLDWYEETQTRWTRASRFFRLRHVSLFVLLRGCQIHRKQNRHCD